MERKYRDRGLKIVLVTQDSAADLRAIPALTGAPVTFLPEATHVFDKYNVSAMPHTILFDARGQVMMEIEGYNEDEMDRLEKGIAAVKPRT